MIAMQDLELFLINDVNFLISYEELAEAVWLREVVNGEPQGLIKVYWSADNGAENFITDKLIPEFNKKLDEIYPKDDDQPQFDSELDKFKWLVKNKLTVDNDRFKLEQ